MIIGEIVEILINLKDKHDDLLSSEYYALEEACNLLDKLTHWKETNIYESVKDRVG